MNREIEVSNSRLRQLKARIVKLQTWLNDEIAKDEKPSLANYIQEILYRRAAEGKSQHSQTLYNLKDAANMLNFLTRNNIIDMAGLDEHFKNMIGEQLDIQDELKPIERRLKTLTEHIWYTDNYLKNKSVYTHYQQEKNSKKQAVFAEKHQDKIELYEEANSYLKKVMNGKTTLPTKAWKAEYSKLTAERNTLNQRYIDLKDEVSEAEQIRKSVYSIIRQEQRERQSLRAQDMEL